MAPPTHRRLATAALLALGGEVSKTAGELLGAAILPHGDFAFDPSLLSGRSTDAALKGAEALRQGSLAAGEFVASLGADVIVLTTPHGIATDRQIAVYGNSEFEGPALVGRDVNASFGDGAMGPGYKVAFQARGRPDLARRLAVEFNAARANGEATVLSSWADDLPMPLRWGEVLPMRYVAPSGRLEGSRLLVLSLPTARQTESGKLKDKMRELGKVLGTMIKNDKLKYALVVSTDLSHRHWQNTTFGAHPLAKSFDEGCGQYAATLDWEVLNNQSTLVDAVYSCGWLGLPMLHGVLEGSGQKWEGRVLVPPVAPTYYGMMVSTIHPRSSTPLETVVV